MPCINILYNKGQNIENTILCSPGRTLLRLNFYRRKNLSRRQLACTPAGVRMLRCSSLNETEAVQFLPRDKTKTPTRDVLFCSELCENLEPLF